MLIAIPVVVTIGGAMAFKAKMFSLQNVWCIRQSDNLCIKKPFKVTFVGADEPIQ